MLTGGKNVIPHAVRDVADAAAAFSARIGPDRHFDSQEKVEEALAECCSPQNVTVIGMTGSGKSSTLDALAGERFCSRVSSEATLVRWQYRPHPAPHTHEWVLDLFYPSDALLNLEFWDTIGLEQEDAPRKLKHIVPKSDAILVVISASDGNHSHPIAKGCILERPKVVYNKKTGKYVMWFHLELKGKGYGSAYAGVATATKPTGPFKFLKAGRVNPGKWPLNMDKKDQTAEFTKEMPDYVRIIRRDYPGGQMSRDMTIFVDDNGKAYHIYSSEGNITLHIAELTPDYTGHTGKYVRAFINRYMEAPAICKHKGKYYLIASGCTGWAPNAARSAVAKNIAGPWMELKNPCVGPKAGITFGGQSTFILPVQGKPGKFIFMADIWRPKNAIDGRYLWLPMKWEGDQIILEWKDEWTLDDL